MRRSFTLAVTLLAGLAAVVQGQEAPKPGPEHEMLKQSEGTWDAEMKSGGDSSKGTMTWKMECGGLWLTSKFVGEFAGQKFEGRGLDGYDPQKKKFVAVWVDSMSTSPLMMEGDYNKEKKTITLKGMGPGPDGTPVKYTSVTTYKDKDHIHFAMSMGEDATEMLTIEYTRKK